jgi:DNA primase
MDQSLIDQIRNANDIVDVIGSYIPLKQAGTNYRGLCPFHKDSNPSLNVSRPKQIFKCFACGKAGNVFGFVQEYEKLSFIEAAKKLAQRAGITIPDTYRTKVVSTKREQLLAVYKSAKDFFASSLFNHGDHVLKYLKDRSLSQDTAKALDLGYGLNSEKALLNHLLKEGYGVSLLKESGLFAVHSGNLVDMFRERLIFPIHNSHGEVVAFGGRVLEGDTSPNKYMNSPGTELYTKGKELYGLFKTRYEIGKFKYALVCEGYFDFLRLYESGFTNSVASLGTALTEDQAYLLQRYSKKIRMLYDGDSAGIKGAYRAGLIFLSRGMEVEIVELPGGLDPDTFILQKGKAALEQEIASAKPFMQYVAETDRLELGTQERIEQIMDSVRKLQDPIHRELLVRECSETFGISTGALTKKLAQTAPQPTEAVQPAFRLAEFVEERQLLALALKDRESYLLLAKELNETYFSNRLYKAIFRFLMDKMAVEGGDNPSSLLDNIENNEIKEGLTELLFEDLQDLRFDDTLKQVKIRAIQRKLDDLDRMIEREPQNLELLKQKQELSITYRRMTKRVVNKVLFHSGQN